MKLESTSFDVAIVGAGPVGLACAGWLARLWGDQAHRIAVFDAKPLASAAHDPRILALSEATRLRLQGLSFPPQATPIHHIHVSEKGRFGQVKMKSDELGLKALGWTVRYGDLVQGLSEAVVQAGVQVFRPVHVRSGSVDGAQGFEVLSLEDGTEYTAALRIDAEGGLYGQAQTRDRTVDYQQWALVSELEVQVEHGLLEGKHTIAFERFTEEGPLALLPISNDQTRYALVWCAPAQQVKNRMALSDAELATELHTLFGRRVIVKSIGKRGSFPLGMSWREKLVDDGRVAIGNAAQILHPVAGQGLNLGLRDATQLCCLITPHLVRDSERLMTTLLAYESSRSLDRATVIRTTDSMVKGFSNQNPLLGVGRQVALNAIGLSPFLRKQFAELMLYGLAA